MFVRKSEIKRPVFVAFGIESEGSVCSNYRNRVCDYIKNRETI